MNTSKHSKSNSKRARAREKPQAKIKFLNKKLLVIIAIVAVVAGIIGLKSKKTNKIALSPEIARSMEYTHVADEDKDVYDENNNLLNAVKFDAYFIADLDGDGIAEARLRGSCNEIGKHANIYMDMRVQNEGYVKDGKITINGNNFYFRTALVKDEVLAKDYISNDTKEINLKDVYFGTQKNIVGAIYSNVGYNNVPNLSKDNNTIVFSGIYVDNDENEYPFEKTVTLTVDWYQEVNCNIKDTTTVYVDAISQLADEDSVTFNFNVTSYESKNTLPLKEADISGTIPELNGYKPLSVTISGTNVTYTYDAETGNFTAQKQAVQNESGVITQNAYSYTTWAGNQQYNRYTDFNFTVVYPKEAYEELGDDVKSLELLIPVQAVNQGFNNPNDEFTNPYISNTANTTVKVIFKVKETTPGQIYNPSFGLSIGDYVGSPYNTYVISKNKPLRIYNGISENETDDTYVVMWRAYTGTNGVMSKIEMYETENTKDEFETTSSQYISMEDLTTNVGIYFSGAESSLGSDGYIKVYDNDTGTLLKEFNSRTWNSYTRANPFRFDSSVKHLKIETSSTVEGNYFYAYMVKELDDEYITENFTKEEFDNFKYIKTNLYGKATYEVEGSEPGSYTGTLTSKALYVAPTSIANISIRDSYISTRETKENEIITITPDTTSYQTQKWLNGTFLVQLPSDIILAEVNNITSTNENVTITAYDVYEENGIFYIKILTENENAESYSINIDCNLTPDPTISAKDVTLKLYATNELASQYYYNSADIYDVDGDLNTAELVNYRTTNFRLETGTGLTTSQKLMEYDNQGSVTVAPRVAKADNTQRTAKIQLSATNNYNTGVQDIKIMGVLPFQGNKFIMGGADLESDYTTYISNIGITAITSGLEGKYTVYYSENETPMQDITDVNNTGWRLNQNSNWKLKEEVTDWSKIKSYIIVIDEDYVLASKQKVEFEYAINIPEGVDYNKTTYTAHAINYGWNVEEGRYYTSTASGKVGLMIAKQFELEILKYQKDKQKLLPGITFTLTEDGQDSSTIKTTDSNGKIVFNGLYTERYYTLKEQKTTEDYVLDDEEIRFYTYITVDENTGDETVHVVTDKDLPNSSIAGTYDTVKEDNVLAPNNANSADYKVQLKIENEPKAKLVITKTDIDSGAVLKNAKFKITGQGKDETVTTDSQGTVEISGLFLGNEYTLEEIKLKDYYIPENKIKFTLINDNGTFKITGYTDNGTTVDLQGYTQNGGTSKITTNNEIPTLNLNLQNEKIPSYSLKITKYAEGETDLEGNDKTLEKAQFKIYGEGINTSGRIYQTDSNGELTINNLYEYVNGKYITGEYTIKEIYAPEGYTVNPAELKFKAYRDNGELKIDIISGEDLIRTVEVSNGGNDTEEQDLNIVNASTSTPTIEIGVDDSQIFSMFKYTEDETPGVQTPIKGTKFKILDLNNNYVTGTDGKTVGELEDGIYVVTTDENGQFTANLPEGLYKAIEVKTDEKYVLPEDEAQRTYYFGVGASRAASMDWKNAVLGQGWNYINSIDSTKDGGVVAVGSFSDYSSDLVSGATDGVDVDEDNIVDEVSHGNNDGIILWYDDAGEITDSITFGGDDDDALNKVIQTSDGGYMAVGYVSSQNVKYNGVVKSDISKDYVSNGADVSGPLAGKDAVMIKLNSSKEYEWGVRFGGTGDDEIKSVIEASTGDFIVVGTESKYSSVLYASVNFCFVKSYSARGIEKWSKSGASNSMYYDVTEYANGIAIANWGNNYAWVERDNLTTGAIIGSMRFDNARITSLDADSEGNIIAAINSGSIFDTKIYKIPATATSITNDQVIYTLAGQGTASTSGGNLDDYVSSVKATSDGGILLGGWYYSTQGLDVDGDGSLDGPYDFPALEGNYTSDGFVIKLDSNYNVVYSSRLYGNGYEGVTAVAETKNGLLASGGYFNGTTLTATNFVHEENDDVAVGTTKLFDGRGNSEGFVIAEGATGESAIAAALNLRVENKIKTYKVTTEVIETNNVRGGDITGETGTIGGTEYSIDGTRYVETVKYGNNSLNEITITPKTTTGTTPETTAETNYVIEYITINGEDYTNYTVNPDGTVTIPVFEEVKNDIHIAVKFSNTISNVEVNHYLWEGTAQGSTEKVAESTTLTGNVGDEYSTLPETDIEYEVITNKDFYGEGNVPEGKEDDDLYIPDNYKGTYIADTKQVVDYYYKEKTYTLTVHHYIEDTNEQVPLKNGSSGQTVEDVVTENLSRGDDYTTSQATDNQVDYSIYELVQTPENAEGTIEEDTEVIYYYRIKQVGFNITKVAEEDHEKTIQGTEFALYKWIGGSAEHSGVIDKYSVDTTKWALVGTYTSSSLGIVRFSNLPITEEYRLIETKASEGRAVTDGQWKIEFMYGNYDQTDTSIITINEQPMKITAIGNPPAFAIESGNLLIPNKESFDFPLSGAFGNKQFYKFGLTIILIGAFILILRKRLLVVKNLKRKTTRINRNTRRKNRGRH
ncbi:MAG: hypothetical protein IKE01_06965 [Clostridia bacterium]|nr:hypothetical protein [Clostridia bacterium]